MAGTLEEILAAVEARLDTIQGLSVADMVPGAINPPQAIVGVPEIGDYRGALAGRRPFLQPTVTILVSSAISSIGQHQLARYASPDGPESIARVVDDDRTLGGVVGDCYVASFRPLGLEEVGVIGYFGGIFVLKVTT